MSNFVVCDELLNPVFFQHHKIFTTAMKVRSLHEALRAAETREFEAHRSPEDKVDSEGKVEIANPSEVLLHRGSGKVRLSQKKVRGDFTGPLVEGKLSPEEGKGISVSVLDDKVYEADLEMAHAAVLEHIFKGRLRSEALEKFKNMEKDKRPNAEEFYDKMDKDKKYSEIIEYLANLEYEEFQSLTPSFCCVRVKNPFYDWAKLLKVPVTGGFPNRFHCLLELRRPTEIDTLNAMATCGEQGWNLCSYMLRAAAKPVIESKDPPERMNGMTLIILDSLDYLLDNFSNGGGFIDLQEVFEIYFYRIEISKELISFQDSTPSGLEKFPYLAAVVDFSIHKGFFIEDDEFRNIIEHDISECFRNYEIRSFFFPSFT